MNHRSLLTIAKKLEDHRIPYSLGGSAMLHYFGLTDVVNDWDITVTCPKEELLEAMKGFAFVEKEVGGHPFASDYRISLPDLDIDFIGNFALLTDTGKFQVPITSVASWNDIRIASPEVWFVAYTLMQREAKANMLLEFLQSKSTIVDLHIIEELLRDEVLPEQVKLTLKDIRYKHGN